MIDSPICPCDAFVHPRIPYNPPGLDAIDYRAGDFTAFRHALLLSLPAETELVNWRPSAAGDLALQMMEWWAYLADILTFYNERIANSGYLRTAVLPEDVRRIIRLLGYRPRPGIGARAVLAALTNGPAPLLLPQGFPIGSKPGPGKQPQIFELDQDTTITAPTTVPVDPIPNGALLVNGGVLVKGTAGTVKRGDRVLLLERNWTAANANYALATVQSLQPERDARGNKNTRVLLTGLNTALTGALARDYRFLYSTASARVWQYPADHVIWKVEYIFAGRASALGGASIADRVQFSSGVHVDLDSLARGIKVGDPLLFDVPGDAVRTQLASVTSYAEAIWFANPPDPADPSTGPPTSSTTPGIPIPHTRIGIATAPGAPDVTSLDGATNRARLLVHFGWQEVGEVLATPVSGATANLTPLVAVPPASLPQISNQALVIEDSAGAGVAAKGSVVGSPPELALAGLPDPPMPLVPPLRALFGLLTVSRGKTVPQETLGSGDATAAGQEFVLQKSPLTYLQYGGAISGDGYTSTLRIWVDGIEWHEAASFYGQPPNAQIFVTREDDQAYTHVLFGDGINGSRLPTGINNVVAWYRYGSGREVPAAGTLNVIVRPQPHLMAVRNPAAAGGGDDPDPPGKIRRYAPRSVLTFGRAISGDDYETIAAQAPGVTRARAYWSWNAQEQRAMVTVYVGDDQAAVDSATLALTHADDPNRPPIMLRATPVPISVGLTLLVDRDRVIADIQAAATAALLDPDSGLFSPNMLRIGELIYRSQIEAACLVPGAVAIHGLNIWRHWGEFLLEEIGFRYSPGEGGFFQLDTDNLSITAKVTANG